MKEFGRVEAAILGFLAGIVVFGVSLSVAGWTPKQMNEAHQEKMYKANLGTFVVNKITRKVEFVYGCQECKGQ